MREGKGRIITYYISLSKLDSQQSSEAGLQESWKRLSTLFGEINVKHSHDRSNLMIQCNAFPSQLWFFFILESSTYYAFI